MSAELIEVRMLRRDLRDPPQHPLPAGYSLRAYHPGDAAAWVQVHLEAERHHEVSPALFAREFGGDDDLLAARQVFACDESGRAVGTATAWLGEGAEAHLGRIHWVAVAERAQGRGLGKALVSALCRRFVELGHEAAFLTTETVRVQAIRMYLGFGFVPDPRDPRERAAWRELAALGLPVPPL